MGLRRHLRTLPLLTALLLTGGPPALAATITEGFDYPAGGSLSGQNGGTGWAGAWSVFDLPSAIIAGLSLPGVPGTGGAVTTTADGQNVATYFRQVSPALGVTGTGLTLSFLLRPETDPGYYGGLNLGGLFIGKSGKAGATNYGLEAPLDDIVASTVTARVGETVWLVLRASFLAGNDRFELFVNPDPAAPLPATADATKTNYDLGQPDYLYINNAGNWTTDEIRISTYPMPAPATAWLLALGLAGLGARRAAPGRGASATQPV